MNTDRMRWTEEEQPDWRDLPSQQDLIEEKDWDVLTVFDACRWDALEAVLDRDIPNVTTPATASTADWLTRVWNREDGFWEDVTYISGNAMSDWVQKPEEFGHDYECDLDNSVGQHVRAFDDDELYDRILGATRPDALTEHVPQYNPPVVVHYMQPHTPFIGNVKLAAKGTERVKEWLPDDARTSGVYNLAGNGDVSPEVVRRAYLENLDLVWGHAKRLQTHFDDVVYTADHGEVLGPDDWSHGRRDHSRARIVPWLET